VFVFDTVESSVMTVEAIDAVPTILDVVCQTTGMGFAAVARVTDDRWIACGVKDNVAFGLVPGGELKIETTICNEIRQHREPVVIDNVAEDPIYAKHHTPAIYGLQSYISMPIILPDGRFFGTLCAIDPKPNKLNTPAVIGMFKLFAELIAFHLDAHERLTESATELASHRHDKTLREQFIAVLGHDLRNPLASIDAGAKMLGRTVTDEKSSHILGLMRSSIQRMSGLIENVLDFARGRLGDGIPLKPMENVELKPLLEQVLAEIASAHPERRIDVLLGDATVKCDPSRIGQLASNLLSNAVTHGATDGMIAVRGTASASMFELTVSNPGVEIPQETRAHLFKPFVRASANPSGQGLGLGLYIASEIAQAHGGTLSVESSPAETRFVFRMPL
jgi:signal transduction histidine kinase